MKVLLVANQTASAQALRDAVATRAKDGATAFHLVVPAAAHGLHRVIDPEDSGQDEAHAHMEKARRTLSEVAGVEVTGEVGDAEPLAAIHDAVNEGDYDEIVVSTLPRRVSRWLHLDLPRKAAGLGLPVSHVEAGEETVSGEEPAATA
jgi:hypothetical protein